MFRLYILVCLSLLIIAGCATGSAGSTSSRKPSGDMADALERAVDQAFKDVDKTSRIAVIHIQTNRVSTTNFLIGELQHILVNRRYNVVDRVDLDVIRKEQNFQYSYEVDDNTAVSLGRFVGADLVVTGGIDGEGSYRRLRLKVLETETAIIRGTGSVPYSEVEQQEQYRQSSYTYGSTPPPPVTPKKTTTRKNTGVTMKLSGGVNLNTFDGSASDSLSVEMNGIIGYHGGLSFDIYLWQSVLMIEPGVRYVHKGYEYDFVSNGVEDGGTATVQLNYADIFAKGKIEIPLGKNVVIQPFVGYGAGILLNAIDKDGEQDDVTKHYNGLIYEIIMGGDMVINDTFVISGELAKGISNVWKVTPKWTNVMYMVTVGLRF